MTDLKTAIYRERKSPFIHPFEGSGADDVFCPSFWVLSAANGCPFDCAYCYLKRTFRGEPPVLFTNTKKMIAEIERWMARHAEPQVLNAGELYDSFGFEPLRKTAVELVELFRRQNKHFLLFLTKSAWYPQIEPTPQVILSYSINAFSVWRYLEHCKTPEPENRLKAINGALKNGWRVRVRYDPIYFYTDINFMRMPSDLIIISIFQPISYIYRMSQKPERLTLGTFRFRPQDRKFAGALLDGLVQDGGDGRLRVPNRAEIYKAICDALPNIPVGLCKETLDVHKKVFGEDVQPNPHGCNCTL